MTHSAPTLIRVVISIHKRPISLAAATLLLAAPLRAETERVPAEKASQPDETIVVPIPSSEQAEALHAPAFATVVNVDDRLGETVSLAEVLAEGVGVRVRSLGGFGSFSSLSVRGASSGNTVVLLDGVPLSRIASVTTDLGRFELGTFSRVEVYRAGAPAEFGAAALGGIVSLTSRLNPDAPAMLSLGVGSFGARHAQARMSSRLGSMALTMQGSYRSAAGDFEYFSDNGTNLNPSDDETLLRSNNGFRQGDLVARVGNTSGAFGAGSRFSFRRQGIPGFGTAQTANTSLETISNLVDAGSRWNGGRDVFGFFQGFSYVERSRYQDLDNEVGLGAQDRRYWTIATGLSAGAGFERGRHRAQAAIDVRLDIFDEEHLGADMGGGSSGQRPAMGLTLSDEVELDDERWYLVPLVRLDVLHTRPAEKGNAATPMEIEPRTDAFVSPRVGARYRIADELSLKANTGYFFRSPTLIEMFGDRGFVVGNPALQAERGISADLGFSAAGPGRHGPWDRLFAESAVFVSRTDDPIAFVANAGGFTGAVNLDTATVYGYELSGSARTFEALTLSGNYTLMLARQLDGNEIPQRPRHQLYGRADVSWAMWSRDIGLWSDAILTSKSFLDVANRSAVPRRFFLGAGVRVELLKGLALALEGKNLLDERVEAVELSPAPTPELSSIRRAVADFFGYPLPGRAVYATLEINR